MVGMEYNEMLVVIVKKGTIHELKDFFRNGQCGYGDAVEMNKEMEMEDLNKQCVAYVEIDETESFDTEQGETYVMPYDGSGVLCFQGHLYNNLLLEPR